MTRPESVFLVSAIFDGDDRGVHAFVWSREEALTLVLRWYDYASVTVYELHPIKGKRTILEYLPFAGLIESRHYETWPQRWKVGYSAEFVQKLLDQYPAPIANPWTVQR